MTTYEVMITDGNPVEREVIRITIPSNYNPRPVIAKMWPQAIKFRKEMPGYTWNTWMEVA